MKRFIIVIFLISFFFISCPLPDKDASPDVYIASYLNDIGSQLDYRMKSSDWTVMYYVDADNNLEEALLEDMEELSEGLESTEMMNVIALVDRIDGYTSDESILGSNFSDTRLFRIGADELYDLSGYDYFPDIGTNLSTEYNMGDAETLKSFIEYCKEYYPADNYALIFSNHGSGVWSAYSYLDETKGSVEFSIETKTDSKGVCFDDTDDNSLYIGELTDVLDSSHSVDLLVYDACLMGMLEIAYEYRPESAGGDPGEFSADYMAASSPRVWNDGLPYDLIFERISQTKTGDTGNTSTVMDGTSYNTQFYDPSSLTAEEFGLIIVEEQERDTQDLSYSIADSSPTQSFALYDLSAVGDVVNELNSQSTGLGLSDLNSSRTSCTYYGGTESSVGNQIAYPFYDLYDFADDLGNTTLTGYIESLIVASFGGSSYDSFAEGKQGLAFFFPDGDEEYNGKTYWNYQWWYTGVDVNSWWNDHYYGNLDFCSTVEDGNVDGWFELLQSLYNPYDPQSDSANYDAYHPGRY